MPGTVTLDLAPDAILEAFENYGGSITDLDRHVTCTAGELRTARDRLLELFSRQGLAAGARVVMSVGNGPAFVTSLAAILAVGGSPLLLHGETPPAELARFALNFGARAVISEGSAPHDLASFAPTATRLGVEPLPPLTLADVDQSLPEFDGNWPELPAVPLHPTSGTTGRPKIAVRPANAAIAEARNYRETMEITDDDTILCVVPMSHAYGFGTSVMLPLISGADVVSTRRFNPRLVERAIEEYPITTFPAVPAMLDLFLLSRRRTSRIPRRVLSAGAPLPERTATAFLEQTGNMICPLYGATETGGISVAVGGQVPSLGACVGPAMRAVSVTVRPVGEAPELKAGVGRVCVRSPSMMAGYLAPGGIDESLIAEGWFETGDLGFLDEVGRIHLVGREKEIINVFGMKVIPSEVEEVIAAYPQVADVKVYGGAHRSGSQIVKAVIAAPAAIDLAALKRHCALHLAPYKRPEVIVRLDELPRSPAGKIIKDRLP